MHSKYNISQIFKKFKFISIIIRLILENIIKYLPFQIKKKCKIQYGCMLSIGTNLFVIIIL